MADQPSISILLNPKDSPALIPSGYGKIARYVAPMLMNMGYEVRLHCPVGHTQGTIDWQDPQEGKMLNIWTGGEGPYGENLTPVHLNRLTKESGKPAVSLFIGDVMALNLIPKFCHEGSMIGAAWGAADWENPTPRWALDKYAPFLRAWTMSKHGHEVLQKDGLKNLLPPLWFGCNTEIWKPYDRSEMPKFMESMGFQEDTFNVFSAFANQYQRKGEYEMFLAVAEFHRRHPEAKIRFFIFSQIRRDWDFVQLAEQLRIKDIIRFSDDYTHLMGEYTELDVAHMMSCADVVLSIGYEGFGFQTVEAQACNVPVIGFAAGATPELLKSGFLVPPAKEFMLTQMIRRLLPDEHKVVEALEEVWRTKENRSRWSHGRQWVLDNLTWKHCAKGLKDRMRALEDAISDQCLLGPPPPGPMAVERAKTRLEITPKEA